MSVHINIRIPDELAARIDELAASESMSTTAVIVNGLWNALCPDEVGSGRATTGKTFSMRVAMNAPQVKAKLDRTMKRGIKKALKASAKELVHPFAKPLIPHAPGCKCLMCKGK